MSVSGIARIELLGKNNFDTWKLQMQAVLIKNDLLEYVSGDNKRPEAEPQNANATALQAWDKQDQKARSEIILAMTPSELKQVKNIETSNGVWLRLSQIY